MIRPAISIWICAALTFACACACAKKEEPPSLIDDEDGARRLARAIYADIALYNADKLDGVEAQRVGEKLAIELEEGRKLFEAKVDPQQHRVFHRERVTLLRAVLHKLRIDSPDAAKFVAKALLDGKKDPALVEEARAFYKSRVPEAHHPLFDEVEKAPR